MPSRDVQLTPPTDITSLPSDTPSTRLVLPGALLKLSAAGEKQQLIKCIVKVVKRSKSQPGTNKGIKRIKQSENCSSEINNKSEVIPIEPIMISRTNLKQQLQREQLQQLEKKERQLSTSAPNQTSNAIRVPLYSSPNFHVPKQVLMVKTKLENPTAYHVRESQQRQVREYISQSHHGLGSSSLPISPHPVVNSLEQSPSSDFSAAVSSNAASPDHLTEDFWQEFPNSNSCSDSVVNNILHPSLPIDVNEPNDSDILSFLSSGLFIPPENVSTSCPTATVNEDGDIMYEEKIIAFQKDRQKKDNHNKIEQRRRFNINDRIKDLGTLLPKSSDKHYELVKDLKQNKGSILKASVEYVKRLKQEVKKIPELEVRCRRIENLNKKFLLRIQSLELQLRENNIPVSDSTWLPSTKAELNAIIKPEPTPLQTNDSYSAHYLVGNHQRLPTVQEQSDEFTNLELSSIQLTHSDPCGAQSRKRLPIMQFLTVKKESQSENSSCNQSPINYLTNLDLSYINDFIMDDDPPVTGDPMLSSRDTFSPENMDYTSQL